MMHFTFYVSTYIIFSISSRQCSLSQSQSTRLTQSWQMPLVGPGALVIVANYVAGATKGISMAVGVNPIAGASVNRWNVS